MTTTKTTKLMPWLKKNTGYNPAARVERRDKNLEWLRRQEAVSKARHELYVATNAYGSFRASLVKMFNDEIAQCNQMIDKCRSRSLMLSDMADLMEVNAKIDKSMSDYGKLSDRYAKAQTAYTEADNAVSEFLRNWELYRETIAVAAGYIFDPTPQKETWIKSANGYTESQAERYVRERKEIVNRTDLDTDSNKAMAVRMLLYFLIDWNKDDEHDEVLIEQRNLLLNIIDIYAKGMASTCNTFVYAMLEEMKSAWRGWTKTKEFMDNYLAKDFNVVDYIKSDIAARDQALREALKATGDKMKQHHLDGFDFERTSDRVFDGQDDKEEFKYIIKMTFNHEPTYEELMEHLKDSLQYNRYMFNDDNTETDE